MISPISIIHADWQAKRLDVALTKKQVANSADINTHEPIGCTKPSTSLHYP